MIGDLASAATARALDTDICVIGSGAAGLSFAAEFLGGRERVLVLESGLSDPGPDDTAFSPVDCIGLRHDGVRDGRLRAFGGTTRVWGGQLLPLRASEMERRSWVTHSGWPIDLPMLEPYYRRAESLLAVEGPPYDEEMWSRLGLVRPTIDGQRFCFRFSQWAPLLRRNFALMLRRRLAASQNVSVLLDATATAVVCDAGGAHARTVEVRSRAGRCLAVTARWFVIACGAIETARLLLASGGPGETGVGNSYGMVGRFFQDHISYVAAEIQPRTRIALQRLFDPRYVGQTMFSVKIAATDRLQRELGLLNAMGHVAFRIPEALGLFEVKRILRSLQAGRFSAPSLDELVGIARGSREVLRIALARALQKRRASPSRGAVQLLVDVEQAPNPASRITLSDRCDAFGIRTAVLDWRLTELESRTLREFSRMLIAEFERLDFGALTPAAAPDFSKRDQLAAARDTFHHMGTARMSRSPREGVTNVDLRCHDVDNLFVAGAAAFPSGGISNPTLTAIALSLRLADYLKTLTHAE